MPTKLKENRDASYHAALRAVGVEVPPKTTEAFHSTEGATDIGAVMVDPKTLTVMEEAPRESGGVEKQREINASVLEAFTEGRGLECSGIYQPLLLTHGSDGRLMVVAGRRRLTAALLNALPLVPAWIRDMGTDDAYEAALIENVVREDMTPLQLSDAYQWLMEKRNISLRELARRIGKSPSDISLTINIFKNPILKRAVERMDITPTQAREMVRLEDDQKAKAIKTVKDSDKPLTQKDTRTIVDNIKRGGVMSHNSRILAAQTQVQLQLPTSTSMPPSEIGRQALAAAQAANEALYDAHLKYKLLRSLLAMGTPEPRQVKELLRALESGRGHMNNVADEHTEAEVELKPRLRMVG